MPSRQVYRRECGYALDDLGLHTLTSSTSSTLVAASLVNATTGASTLNYDDRYVYVASGSNPDQQVRVRPSGYAPSTGTLPVYPNWTSPAPAVVEITRLFPVMGGAGEHATYHALINQALSFIDIRDVISPTITTASDISLATWAAWIAEDRIDVLPDTLDVREPAPVSGYPAVPAPFRQWIYGGDAQAPYLRTHAPFAVATGGLEVRVRRPASSWIRVSSVWGESTVGLANESDEALPEAKDVADIFLMLAYRALMHRQSGTPSDPTMMAKFLDARDKARSVRGYNRNVEQRAIPEMADLERAA